MSIFDITPSAPNPDHVRDTRLVVVIAAADLTRATRWFADNIEVNPAVDTFEFGTNLSQSRDDKITDYWLSGAFTSEEARLIRTNFDDVDAGDGLRKTFDSPIDIEDTPRGEEKTREEIAAEIDADILNPASLTSTVLVRR